ncbi:hypothetical protein Hanom_Chr09g00814171 [Helianthus anomalus]
MSFARNYFRIQSSIEKVWKRLEDVGRHWTMSAWGKRTRKGSKTFFNEMSSKKQTVCRAKRLRMVCAAQT